MNYFYYTTIPLGSTLSWIFAGCDTGTALFNPLNGILIHSGIMGGWPAPFYVTAMLTVIWLVIWAVFVHSTPQESPWVCSDELKHIMQDKSDRLLNNTANNEETLIIPWMPILTSIPVWANMVGYFSMCWIDVFMLTGFPLYLNDAFGFTVEQVCTSDYISPI